MTVYRTFRAISSLLVFLQNMLLLVSLQEAVLRRAVSCWPTSQNIQGHPKFCELLTGAMFFGACCTCALPTSHILPPKTWVETFGILGFRWSFASHSQTVYISTCSRSRAESCLVLIRYRHFSSKCLLACLLTTWMQFAALENTDALSFMTYCCISEIVVVISHEDLLRKNKIPMF